MKELPAQGPLHGASSKREAPSTESPLSFSQSPRYTSPRPGSRNGAPMERDARLQSLFYISFRVPSKKSSFQVPFTELPQRETPHLQSPFNHISKFLVDEPTPGCLTESP